MVQLKLDSLLQQLGILIFFARCEEKVQKQQTPSAFSFEKPANVNWTTKEDFVFGSSEVSEQKVTEMIQNLQLEKSSL